MLQIMRRFGWTWVGLVFLDHVGLDAAHIIQSELAQSGWGCLAYSEALPRGRDPAELQRIVSLMKTSTARVVVVFEYGLHLLRLMDEVRVGIHTMRELITIRNLK